MLAKILLLLIHVFTYTKQKPEHFCIWPKKKEKKVTTKKPITTEKKIWKKNFKTCIHCQSRIVQP